MTYHTHTLGDEVYIEVATGTYNGKMYPGFEGKVVITEAHAMSMAGHPMYKGVDALGGVHGFIEKAIKAIPEDLPETLRDHADTIADYLSLDAADSEVVHHWVELLRGHANGRA